MNNKYSIINKRIKIKCTSKCYFIPINFINKMKVVNDNK